MKANVKYTCRNCKYFNTCGSTSRTQPCEGRELKPRKAKHITTKKQPEGKI